MAYLQTSWYLSGVLKQGTSIFCRIKYVQDVAQVLQDDQMFKEGFKWSPVLSLEFQIHTFVLVLWAYSYGAFMGEWDVIQALVTMGFKEELVGFTANFEGLPWSSWSSSCSVFFQHFDLCVLDTLVFSQLPLFPYWYNSVESSALFFVFQKVTLQNNKLNCNSFVEVQVNRRTYFRGELIEAMVMLERGIGPRGTERMQGSWAGAMGQCQFMPTSFCAYAVDHDGDGRRGNLTQLHYSTSLLFQMLFSTRNATLPRTLSFGHNGDVVQ